MLATASLAIAFLGAAVAAVDSPYFGRPVIPRPAIKAYPLTPGTPHAESPPRDPNKYCFVKPSCKSDDDAANILAAFHECNHGGTVVLDASYTIGTRLDLTFLDSVDVALSGTVTFSGDLDYWVANSFKYNFQNSSAFWRIGGRDVNIYGGGVGLLHGNGQPWWDAFAANSSLLRPILMVIDGLQGGSISGLNMMNSPNWFNWIANSSDIIVSDINIRVGASTSSNPAKNTDGWDTYRSDGIVIQNSVINNGDDCVSFKPNSTNIVVQGLSCNGSHGVSVGSLGQYIDEFDIVENVYIYNISMANASDMARIKVWPGSYTPFQPTLNGGGGRGYVKNVTYDELYVNNVDWSIELTQCYGQSNQTLCNQYPSNVTISDVVFKNMWGIASKKNDPKVGTLICSSPDKCNNIQAYNISISTPSGKTPSWICTNMDNSLLDINCIT